jgi:hypothetical protein
MGEPLRLSGSKSYLAGVRNFLFGHNLSKSCLCRPTRTCFTRATENPQVPLEQFGGLMIA